jgi:hypothetical protein
MRFDGWDTIEGRHLVIAYATVALIQLGYAGWVLRGWLRLGVIEEDGQKKARKPVN